jgi:hypothetical protein
MNVVTDPKQAGERLLTYAREGRLVQGTWQDEKDGREIACLLGAAAGITDADQCPASLMPAWVAHALPSLFDEQSKSHASSFAILWGEAMVLPEWAMIDWDEARTQWLAFVVAQAKDAAADAARAARAATARTARAARAATSRADADAHYAACATYAAAAAAAADAYAAAADAYAAASASAAAASAASAAYYASAASADAFYAAFYAAADAAAAAARDARDAQGDALMDAIERAMEVARG